MILQVLRKRLTIGLAIGLVALVSVVFQLLPRSRPVSATPHTISAKEHPYDPDWPDVFLIISTKCIGCHREGSDSSDFSSYEALLSAEQGDGTPVVIPGKAHDSIFWEQVAWNVNAIVDTDLPDRPEMPPEHHESLTAGQLEIVERWINNGALQYKLPNTCSIKPLMEIDFPSAKQCAPCHPRQYEQWSRSMHAYAQHSPVFMAFNLTLLERTSGTIGTFCSRCHTPLGTELGEEGGRRNVHRSRLSMEGVTCIVCHRRPRGNYKASGRVGIEAGKLLDTCMYGPFDDSVNLDGVPTHASQGLPYIKTSQFCGECHDVTTPEGVRLEEAFSEWQNSPAAKEGITCQQCHMGPIQGTPIPENGRPLGRAAVVPGVDEEQIPLRHLTDHTFAGPDYSLLPDTEFPHKLDWMYEVDYRDTQHLTPYQHKTLQSLRRRNRKQLLIADQKRYELLTSAAEISVCAPESVRLGETVDVKVDVTNKVSGHSFPTGFTAERQLWISIVVRDPQGRVVFTSGDLDKNGDLRDGHSHEVLTGKIRRDKYLLNFQNKFISLANRGTERSVIISVNRDLQPLNILRPATGISASFGRPGAFRIAKGSLPPLATMGRKYPVYFYECPGAYTLSVKLNYRHLPPTLLDHIGTPHLKHLLEVVVIDEYESIIQVMP